MPFNLSAAGNSKRVSFGSGLLRVRAYDSTTPTSADDAGYGRGGSLNVTREKVDLRLGTPRTLVIRYAVQENVTLQFNSVEWSIPNIANTLGAGVQSGSATDKTMLFGGDTMFNEVSVTFIHQMAAGGTVTLDLWRCQGVGEIAVNTTDDIHEIPYNFEALVATSDWTNALVNSKGSLFRMRIQV